MNRAQDNSWCEIYIQLKQNIIDLTPEEVEQVMSYVLALKSERKEHTCEAIPH